MMDRKDFLKMGSAGMFSTALGINSKDPDKKLSCTDPRYRLISFSKSGGEMWDSSFVCTDLPDPVCQGSILNIKFKGKQMLFFSNPSSQTKRENLTIKASDDDGISWKWSFSIDKGPASYSDLVYPGKKDIGILYEKNSINAIVYSVNRIKYVVSRKSD